MRARTQEMSAKVVRPKRLVPQADGRGIRSGNLGVMDYVRMKNVHRGYIDARINAGGEKRGLRR